MDPVPDELGTLIHKTFKKPPQFSFSLLIF